MTTIILFVLILGLLILVHELGHFVVARRLGTKVEEFGIGFPPRIAGVYRDSKGRWRKVIGGKEVEDEAADTIYSLNWLPLGGFCKIKGEDGEGSKDKDSSASKKIWKRALILVAGVTMNILLAMVLLIVGFKVGLPTVIEADTPPESVVEAKVQVVVISGNSPAQESGLQVGDEILTVADNSVTSVESIQNIIDHNLGEEVSLKIKRGDQEQILTLVPRRTPPADEGPMGVALVKTGIISYPWYQAIGKGIMATFSLFFAILVALFGIIKNLLIGAGVTEELSGPVGIAVMTGQVARMGFVYVLQFIAVLSINLAIINLFPLPALDGGRLLFLIIEKIRGKKVNRRIENTIHMIGFILLILLMLVITFRDVFKFKDLFIDLGRRITGL